MNGMRGAAPWPGLRRQSARGRSLSLNLVALGAAALSACATGVSPGSISVPSAVPSARAVPAVEEIEGLFDVGDYSLYLECRGSGEPTVVYLHGYIGDVMSGGRNNSGRIPSLLYDRVRVCKYDRVNVGKSEKTDETQTGLDAVRDLNALLAAADVPGPYVLLGASFGGIIAYEYAFEHPDDVAGMVLLDPALAGDYRILDLIPEDERAEIEEGIGVVERLDDPETTREAERLAGPAPAIPVTMLSSEVLELPPTWPAEDVTQLVRDLQQRMVDQFSPGELILVDSPHFMEQAIPERVAQEVERILDRIEEAS